MHFVFGHSIFKQATLSILCGLLAISTFSQPRSKEEVLRTINTICKSTIINQETENFELKARASHLLKDFHGVDNEPFYIYTSKKKNGGFIIVSGDKRMPTVLAYSDKGSFDIDNIPTNVSYYLSCYAESFKQLQNNGIRMQEKPNLNIRTTEVPPLLGEIQWGQDKPYNMLCPMIGRGQSLTGCVATGMAQVMKYHKYPDQASGKIQYITNTNRIQINEDLSLKSFDWDNMRNNYNQSFSQEQADAVAQLMYYCGVAVNMDYNLESEGGSGAYQPDLVKAYIHNFDYDEDATYLMRSMCTFKDWHQIMINELSSGRPINYAGQSLSSGGHSFVIDGYRMSEENIYPDYHINWGWEGQCDGYYQILDLTPTEGGLQGTTDGFNVDQEMVIGIQPKDGISHPGTYIILSDLKISDPEINSGSSSILTIESCINMSYQLFEGSLNVVLQSTTDSTEYFVGVKEEMSLPFLQEFENIEIKINIPDTLSSGTYKVELRSIDSSFGFSNRLLSKKIFTIDVLDGMNDEGGNKDDVDVLELGCSELELKSSQDSSYIQVNLYELTNLKEDAFTGYIRMLLTDSKSNVIMAFGDSVLLEDVGYKETLNRHKTLKGSLIGNFADGEYRLYVGVRKMNEKRYKHVALYDRTIPNQASQELYFKVQIKNDIIYIKNNVYKVIPALIHPILKSSANSDDSYGVYTANSTFIGYKNISELRNMPPGIYILKCRDYTRKIIK